MQIKCTYELCEHFRTNYCKYICQFNEFKERNNKKHASREIDIGFWDINGDYIEDYQEVDEKELNIKDEIISNRMKITAFLHNNSYWYHAFRIVHLM